MQPLGLVDWASFAAIISAMCDVLNTGRDAFQEFFDKHTKAPDSAVRAASLQKALSTYSEEEKQAILERLQRCRDRFKLEGSGAQRRICFCSVLQDVKDGECGIISDPEWQRTYDQMACAALKP